MSDPLPLELDRSPNSSSSSRCSDRRLEIFTADHIDWDTLCSRALQFYPSATTATWGEQLSGASNVVRVLHIHDSQNTALAARAPLMPLEGWSASTTAYAHIRDRMTVEVATMQCVAEKTKIPLPHVVDWNCDLDGGGVGSPYILMSHEKGEVLLRSWDGMDDADRATILQQIASIYTELNLLRFDKMGSVVRIEVSNTVKYTVDSVSPVYQKGSDDLPSFLRTLQSCLCTTSSREFWDHCAQAYLDDTLELDFGSDFEEKIQTYVDVSLIRSFIPILYTAGNNPPFLRGGFPLYHGDFDAQNIVVTDRIHIQALLDWEYSNTGLVTSLAVHPPFFSNCDWTQPTDAQRTRNLHDQTVFCNLLRDAENTAEVPDELRISHLLSRPYGKAFELVERILQGGYDRNFLYDLYNCMYGEGGPLQPAKSTDKDLKSLEDADSDEDNNEDDDEDDDEDNANNNYPLGIALDMTDTKKKELSSLHQQLQRETEILLEAKRVLSLDDKLCCGQSRTSFIALLRDHSTELTSGLHEWLLQQIGEVDTLSVE